MKVFVNVYNSWSKWLQRALTTSIWHIVLGLDVNEGKQQAMLLRV